MHGEVKGRRTDEIERNIDLAQCIEQIKNGY